jgi:LacI family transcriptional regulator
VARRQRNTGFLGISGYSFEERPRMSYWSQVLEGMQECAKREGRSLVLLNSDTLSGWDKVDGLVIADPNVEHALHDLPADLPRVSILSDTSEHASVAPNDYYGGQIATEHLLDLGHRRIACLMDRDVYPTCRRFAGYKDALERTGIIFDSRWVRDYGQGDKRFIDFVERGKEVMREWLSEDWRDLGCTALLVQNDLVALGVMHVLLEAGISIPGQVSLVGFDDLDICNFVTPALTSVHVPLREIGWTAVDLLFREIETGRSGNDTKVLPVSLHRRQSTAQPPR